MNNYCYIHIPFCTSKCKYCRFASFWTLDKLKIDLYVHHLIKEIEIKKTDFSDLKSVYFGWWTPSTLSFHHFDLILNKLKEKYIFEKNIEINIEATPNTITKENLIWWKKLWINRLSIWVQTLNNKSLVEIWRGNKWDILNALNIIKEEWFNNISIDFIIWLPFVKKWEIKKNIEYILNEYSFIKHISVYMLEEYYNIPEDIDSKFENITYPTNWNTIWINDDEYELEYIDIKNFLISKNFYSYEISNFSKKWFNCKHNRAYWSHDNILAFWLWAHWFINNTRYSNSENFINYYSWKDIQYEELNDEDIYLESIMFWLRTSWLKKEIYENLDFKKINSFILDWYLYFENDILRISNKWIMVLDYILKEIL